MVKLITRGCGYKIEFSNAGGNSCGNCNFERIFDFLFSKIAIPGHVSNMISKI